MDEENLKLNYIGIFGGVLALISIVLPWISIFVFNLNLLDLVNLTALASALPGVAAVEAIIYGTFALLIIGGIFGLVGGCIAGGKGKSILGVGGVLTILSIIVFAAGLGSQGVPLFVILPAIGFWLALIAGIIMLVAMKKHPIETTPT
jgi:hypothetical protein